MVILKPFRKATQQAAKTSYNQLKT